MLRTINPFLKNQEALRDFEEARRTRSFLLVWVIYIFLSPFYIFSSGTPQPADMVVFTGILAFFSYALLKPNYRDNNNDNITSVYAFGGIFVGLTMTINFVHYIFTPDLTFILHSIAYPFNFAIFLFGVYVFKKAPVLANKLTYQAIVVICFVQLFAVIFYPDPDHYRGSGTFNQSNQLAYWGILTAALIIVLKRNQPMKLLDFALFAIIGYVEMKALSKAGLIVYVVLVAIVFWSPIMSSRKRWFTLFCLLVLLAIKFHTPQNIMLFIDKVDTLEAVSDRLLTIGKERDDSAEGRGYSRILEHPHFLIFGAGEGAYDRFSGREFHSGLGTLLFSYSIFGFGFFVMFLGSIFYRLPWHYTAMLIPIFLYGVTHQNIRFSLFWVFLAVSFAYHFLNHDGLVETKTKKRGRHEK